MIRNLVIQSMVLLCNTEVNIHMYIQSKLSNYLVFSWINKDELGYDQKLNVITDNLSTNSYLTPMQNSYQSNRSNQQYGKV